MHVQMHVRAAYHLQALNNRMAGLLGGQSMFNSYVKSHSFGTISGLRMEGHIQVQWLTVCVVHVLRIIMQFVL